MMTLRAPQHYQQAVKIVCLSIIINFVITPVTPIDPFTSEKVDDGCSLRHEVLDVVVCEEEVSCNVPLHKSAVLMCPGQSGKWVYSNSTVSLGESSNLTLTRVHFNDSGSYHYDSKIPCNFIVSVGEPPMVTAPQLHDRGLGCYQLPQPFFAASTDVGLKIICNTTSKDIKWYMSNDNNMDRVPATGVNNKQVYSLPLFYGKENTIEMFTCVVTNLYGNTTLTYVINITQAPTDNDAIYEKVKAKSQEVNCTKGKDMMLFYEMKFYASFSLAKFCFFPKGSYNPLFKFMDSNSSTCCVCQVTNCTKCNNITKWTISITQHSATFIFTLHLKDVNPNNYGLYTMTACVYQVDVDSCGSPAWTEIKMCKHADEWNTKLVLLVGGCVVVTLVFLVVMVKYIIPSFCYCYFKSSSEKATEENH